jgi:hypothetical protein
MISGCVYCLKADILSIYARPDGKKDYLYVPAGATITIGEPNSQMGLFVEVHWDSKTIFMFPQDIEDRAEMVPVPVASNAGQQRRAAALGFSR